MQDQCSRCGELWWAYAQSTVRHVSLIHEQERAAAADVGRFQELESMVLAAGAERAAARAKVLLHQKIVHQTLSMPAGA
jgi:hypothetical protein